MGACFHPQRLACLLKYLECGTPTPVLGGCTTRTTTVARMIDCYGATAWQIVHHSMLKVSVNTSIVPVFTSKRRSPSELCYKSSYIARKGYCKYHLGP